MIIRRKWPSRVIFGVMALYFFWVAFLSIPMPRIANVQVAIATRPAGTTP